MARQISIDHTRIARLAHAGVQSTEAACSLMMDWSRMMRLARAAGISFVDIDPAPPTTGTPVTGTPVTGTPATGTPATGAPAITTPEPATNTTAPARVRLPRVKAAATVDHVMPSPNAGDAQARRRAEAAALQRDAAAHPPAAPRDPQTLILKTDAPRPAGSQPCRNERASLPDNDILGPEEEQRLIRAWQEDRDRGAALKIVDGHRALINGLLRRAHVPQLREDLEQTLIAGILDSLDSFDPDHGCRLTTHLRYRLKSVLYGYLMDNTLATRLGTNTADKKLWYRFTRMRASWERTTGRPLSDAGRTWIARKLEIHVKQVERFERRMQGDVALSLDDDEPIGEDVPVNGQLMTELHIALTDDGDTPEEATGRAHAHALGGWLMTLAETEVERDVLHGRLANDGRKLALQTIGERHGLSRKRVNTIEARLIRRMQQALAHRQTARRHQRIAA